MSAPDGRRRVVAGLVGTAVGLTGLAFVVRLAARERETLAAMLAEPRTGWLTAACLAGLLGMAGIGRTWGVILRRLGACLPAPVVLRGYFVGQLGKYVPGGVWGIVGRGEWARRGGAPRLAAYSATVLSMATAYLAACTLGLVCLLTRGAIGGVSHAGLLAAGVAALAPIGLTLLHPRVTGAVLAWIGRAMNRTIDLRLPAWGPSLGFVALQLPSWLLIAAATWATAEGLAVDLDPLDVALATAVSWVVGFLALPVPGGIGVREATFVALLGGGGEVAAVALSARLVFVLVDLLGAAAASAWLATVGSGPAAPGNTPRTGR